MTARLLVILVVLLGAAAACYLPVALYPQMVPPTIVVTAHYPAASPETVASTVAQPIEQQVNAVPGMLYMQSESTADGFYTLTVTFAIGTDVDAAQALVGKRVADALPRLPGAVQAQGFNVRAKSTDVLMVVALALPGGAPENLYASIVGELARLPGVVAHAYGEGFLLDGQPAVGIAISKVPGANGLAVAHAVRARMAELAGAFPPGLTYSVPLDTTLYIRAVINGLYGNLFAAVILVLAVILVFCRDWRATALAAVTLGVTVIGACAAIAAMGFSLNLATLLAIILAIAVSAEPAGDPAAPMIRTPLMVLAVFIPAAFLPGVGGKFFAPFAVVMAEAVLISRLCTAAIAPFPIRAWPRLGYETVYLPLAKKYLHLVRRLLARARLVVFAALILEGCAIWGLVQIPRGLLPAEDQGIVLLATQWPHRPSPDRTRTILARIAAAVRSLPGVDRVVTLAGISAGDGNAGLSTVVLKDWRPRDGLLARLSAAADAVENGATSLIMPPAIAGLGQSGGFTMQLELRDGSLDYRKLAAITRLVVARAATQSGLSLLSAGVLPPALIEDFNLYPAATVRGTAARGFSSGEALGLMAQIAAQTLPRGIGHDWTGMSYQENAIGAEIFGVFAVAILLVYLALAAQYKSFLAPLPVVLTIPLALPGPVIALDAFGLDNDLFVQIGLLLLIVLASRDAMRIIDVARRRRADGMAINAAALEAARARFAPMLMTALAGMAGVIPLLAAHGAGAESCFAVGITVFSGLIASTLLTMLFVPAFFVVLQKPRKAAPERISTPQSGSKVARAAP